MPSVAGNSGTAALMDLTLIKRNSFLERIHVPSYVSIFKTPNIFPGVPHLHLNLQPENRHGDTSFMGLHFHGSVLFCFLSFHHSCGLRVLATRGCEEYEE